VNKRDRLVWLSIEVVGAEVPTVLLGNTYGLIILVELNPATVASLIPFLPSFFLRTAAERLPISDAALFIS
jgi:hypothetical protein